MRVWLLALAIVLVAFSAVALSGPISALADPTADLAAAEESESAARSQVSAAEQGVRRAEEVLTPVEKLAVSADETETEAISHADSIKEDLVEERTDAAGEVKEAEADYEDEKATHDTIRNIGIGLTILALLAVAGAFVYSRIKKWPLSKRLTQIGAGAFGLLCIGGLVLVFLPGPDAPQFSKVVEELAVDAEGDPADPPTQELLAAEADVKPLAAEAKPLDAERERAEGKLSAAESDLDDAEGELSDAKREVSQAQGEVEQEERLAAKEAEFKEQATTVDYNELIKNPYKYTGEKVVYTGQIFQIQEEFGSSVILLSVTDEGYGFWTDEIWVDAPEVAAVEEDIITVYGTVTGGEEYETRIGGSNFVPKVKAKYVEE